MGLAATVAHDQHEAHAGAEDESADGGQGGHGERAQHDAHEVQGGLGHVDPRHDLIGQEDQRLPPFEDTLAPRGEGVKPLAIGWFRLSAIR